MKGNAVYKGAHNRALALLAPMALEERLPNLSELANRLEVSRTTVRSVLAGLLAAGVVRLDGRDYHLARQPLAGDHYPEPQTLSAGASLERRFMEWILQGDFQAGQLLNSADLARRFGTSTTTIREYLSHFQHFGLIERRPNSAWIYRGITRALAEEIYEVREMFELRAARRLIERPADDPCWAALAAIEAEHRALLADLDQRYRDFPALDEKLHRLVHDSSANRYIREFYAVLSAIFHYTYRWNREDERERNTVALRQHLDYIAALHSRDLSMVERQLRHHLASSRQTMLRSIDYGPYG